MKKILKICAMLFLLVNSTFVFCAESNKVNNSWKEGVGLVLSGLQIVYSIYQLRALLDQGLEVEKPFFNIYSPGEIHETLDSVVGNDEAKQELKRILNYLKNPAMYDQAGSKPVKGILLLGDPGNGKTLLARCFAGEIQNAYFIRVSGSSFSSKYYGEGVQRVKKLFTKAHQLVYTKMNKEDSFVSSIKNAIVAKLWKPVKRTKQEQNAVIIFIDEIDAMLGKRNDDSSCQESNRVVNEFLTQMDGFASTNNKIIVIGATNFADRLDEAAIRPGRFDKKIEVQAPEYEDRVAMLKMYLNKINHQVSDDCIKLIALKTCGKSAAFIKGIVEQAKRLIEDSAQGCLIDENLRQAYAGELLGDYRKQQPSDKMLIETAYHEVGHMLIRHFLSPCAFVVDELTIQARTKVFGYASMRPVDTNELKSETLNDCLNHIAVFCGGMAAEQLMLGTPSLGVQDDMQKARSMIKQMLSAGMLFGSNLLQKTEEETINFIINQELGRAKTILTKHKDLLIKIALKLVEKKTLRKDDLDLLLPKPSILQFAESKKVEWDFLGYRINDALEQIKSR